MYVTVRSGLKRGIAGDKQIPITYGKHGTKVRVPTTANDPDAPALAPHLVMQGG